MNNTPTETTAIQAVSNNAALAEPMRAQASSLMLDVTTMESLMRVANLMASGKCTIPKHLQDSPADCMAVVMQSMQWGMNPFAVAQKTHISPSGALGYEAQLISAVVCANAPVKESAPEYEYIGDWSKVLGKVEERKSDKGGKYYVATYTRADEAGLGVICRMTLRGESKPREITVMLTQCYPRFSTQWATDPKQQISYVAIRKWSRLFSSGTILGVYAPEEMAEEQPNRDMGNADVLPAKVDVAPYLLGIKTTKTDAEAAAYWKEHNPKFVKQPADHAELKDAVIAHRLQLKNTRTVDMETGEIAAKEPSAKSFDEIMTGLCGAANLDALYVWGEWIETAANADDRKALEDKFNEMQAKLEGV